MNKSLKIAALAVGSAMLVGCGMNAQQMEQMNTMQESMNEMMRMVNTIDYNASQAKQMASENKIMMRMMMKKMDMSKNDQTMMKKMMK